MSLRLVDQYEEDQLHKRLAAQAVLAKLTAASFDDSESLAAALLGAPDLLDLVPADGVVVHVQDEHQVRGSVPTSEVVDAVAGWARDAGTEIVSTDCLSRDLPGLDVDPQVAAGALAVNLPDGQYAVWFRGEVVRSVDWGGDPHNKAIAISEGDSVRLSPRKSFDRWREIVHRRGEPWMPTEIESAEGLRRQVVESLYRRTRVALRLAEILQRGLLPESIPALAGWTLSAHYEPAVGGNVGGDWYDAFALRDGRLVVLLGDVAGHGIAAAGTMAQLRNALRAQLFAGANPAEALDHLNDFCVHLLPRAFATVIAARVELESGRVEAASAGHLIPFLTNAETAAVAAPIRLSPPIGVEGSAYKPSTFTIEPGHGLVLFSDGLVERRHSTIDDGLLRLAHTLGRPGYSPASAISTAMTSGDADDDVTIVTLQRN